MNKFGKFIIASILFLGIAISPSSKAQTLDDIMGMVISELNQALQSNPQIQTALWDDNSIVFVFNPEYVPEGIADLSPEDLSAQKELYVQALGEMDSEDKEAIKMMMTSMNIGFKLRFPIDGEKYIDITLTPEDFE